MKNLDESVCDQRGIPIWKGDLVRSPYLVGARNKLHYLYHVVVEEKGIIYLVPTSHLEPSLVRAGGKCPLMAIYADTWASEIISGDGPDPYVSFEDRPRRKTCTSCGEFFLGFRSGICEDCKQAKVEDEEEARCMKKQPK